MIPVPENTVDCWFVTKDELDSVMGGKPFVPSYLVYAYFKLTGRIDEDTIEGLIGRKDTPADFHEVIRPGYTYFDEYLSQQRVYLTLDKVTFYELREIFPAKPLLFMLKRLIVGKSATNSLGSGLKPAITVQPLHFEELFGGGFERLVFAFVKSLKDWDRISWLGETGKDEGRDIWALSAERSYCYQCANYRELTLAKAIEDIDKLVLHGHTPDFLVVVCGGRVSANLREKIIGYAAAAGFADVDIWSGAELEERLRKTAPQLVERFFNGVAFPGPGSGLAVADITQPQEAPPVLTIALEPVFGIEGTDEDIAVFIEEAFYFMDKGRQPALAVSFTQEEVLKAKLKKLDTEVRDAANRKQAIALKKILDALEELRQEIIEKIQLMYYADLYPIRQDYERLATSLRQLLLISITPDRLYEETDIANFVKGQADYKKPFKGKGQTKIDLRNYSGSILCSVWMPQADFDHLIAKRIRPDQVMDMWFYGFEVSDLSIDTLAERAIPSFIDKIYELKHTDGGIERDDNTSWTHFPSYVISLG